jgi:hypothetical protein
MRFRRTFGDDTSEPTVSLWGDIPFADPGVVLQPVPVNLPDISNLPGLNPPSAGVSTDDAGMSVVTVTAPPSTAVPGWIWVALAGLALYAWSKS